MAAIVFLTILFALVYRAKTEINSVSSGNNLFGFNVYKELAKEDGNILFSPFSAESVLALTYFGARSRTANEMSSALNLPDQNLTPKLFKSINSQIRTKETNITLTTANKIYVDGVKFRDDFKNTAIDSFDADIESLSFKNTDAAAHVINSWVEKQTHDKIRDLVEPPMLQGARMVLVNAVYFLGNWKRQFKLSDSKLKFYTSETSTVDVPMMETIDMFHYVNDKDLNAEVLFIPYENVDYSLIMILPNEIHGLSRIEQQFPLDLPKLLSKTGNLEVIVKMPKFKIEQGVGLKNILERLGMQTAFTPNADFRGISDEESLLISEVLQKGYIDVSENGTEAAVATIDLPFVSSRDPVPQFTANRPFLFFIYHHTTNLVLFMGRVKQFEN